MKRYLLILMILTSWIWSSSVSAEDAQISVTISPETYASVKGDAAKFREINWIKDGSTGAGIKDATYKAELDEETTISFEGGITPKAGDGDASILLEKEDVGFIKLEYDQFRKYSDNSGGYFPSFPTNSITHLNKALELDIGNLFFEIGTGSPDDPDLSFSYERQTKEGDKSSTIWDTVADSAFGGTSSNYQRKIAPSSSDIDNVTHTLAVKGKAKVAGFDVKGDQKYSFFEGDKKRESRVISTTAADQEYTRVDYDTQTKQLSTTLTANRWSLNEKSYLAFGYRFDHLKNREIYDVLTFDQNKVYSSGIGSAAKHNQDVHIWTGQFLSNLSQKLAFISRFRAQITDTKGASDRASAITAGGARTINDYYYNEQKVTTFAEHFALRYAMLPRMNVYTELDLQQEREWRFNNGNHSSFELTSSAPESVGTIGTRFSPMKSVDVTTEYKAIRGRTKINTIYQPGNPDFAFYDRTKVLTHEVGSRISWKPTNWIQGSFRYNESKQKRDTRPIESLAIGGTESNSYQRDFVYSVSLIPNDQWLFDLSFTMERLWINETEGISSTVPASTSHVNSILFATSFTPSENVSFFNTIEYGRADNITNSSSPNLTDTNANTVPGYDVDNEWFNIDTGLTWEVKEDVTIEPHYAYLSFRENEGIETGNYSAHLVGVDVNFAF